MLIRASQKPRVTPLHPVISRLGIRQKRCRCRSNMRYGIDIVNGGGDIRSHGEFLTLSGEAARCFKGVMAATRATGAEPLSHRLGQSSDNTVYRLPDLCYSSGLQNQSLRTLIAGELFPETHMPGMVPGHPYVKMAASFRIDYGTICT
jgi:hypothetical protein